MIKFTMLRFSNKKSFVARDCRSRWGTTTMEVIVGCALMATALLTTSIYRTRIVASSHDLRAATLARAEVINARELIGSWPADAITETRITELSLREDLRRALPESNWIANVATVDEPIIGKRVFIDLQWTSFGQTHSTSGITFWVSGSPKSNSDAESPVTNGDQEPRP
jgi:hypothetical protein